MEVVLSSSKTQGIRTVSNPSEVVSSPKFENPPVIETVLGVQFDRIPDLHTGLLGAYWNSLGGDWTNLEEATALEQAFENFEQETSWSRSNAHLRFHDSPPIRFRIRNAENDRMIQVQNGRFHYNWLGHQGGPYPSYESVKPEFVNELDRFRKFLRNAGIEELRPNQWEVTYVNHIPRGTLWETPDDWQRMIGPFMSAQEKLSVVTLEGFAGEWHYEIRDRLGRLHVQVNPARESSGERRELLRMTLTARGAANAQVEMVEGLDLGHKAIVSTFAELTTKAAHEFWGRAL